MDGRQGKHPFGDIVYTFCRIGIWTRGGQLYRTAAEDPYSFMMTNTGYPYLSFRPGYVTFPLLRLSCLYIAQTRLGLWQWEQGVIWQGSNCSSSGTQISRQRSVESRTRSHASIEASKPVYLFTCYPLYKKGWIVLCLFCILSAL